MEFLKCFINGGEEAKVLAAHRAGMTTVILPRRNARDVEELPESVQEAIEFILVDDVAEALSASLSQDACQRKAA